jgi:hypothetical protein
MEANRRNAWQSTGPRPPEGQARSAAATTHGLSILASNPLNPSCFLRIEDEAAFKGLLDEYVVTYQPQHRDELDLLTEAVYAKFRQQRVWMAETGQIEIAIARNEVELNRNLPRANAHAHLANGFTHSENMLKLYLRYDAQLHRHYKSCLQQLQDLQAARLPETDPALQPGNVPPPASPNEPIAASPPEPESTSDPDRSPINGSALTPAAIKSTKPNEPKLSPAEEEIRRYEERRDQLLARFRAAREPNP